MTCRRGKVTASRVADVIKRTKSGYSTSRKNYAAQLLCERMTGRTAESFTNAAMQWGVEKEPEARTAYEFMKDVTVELVSFVDHPSIAMSGASRRSGLARMFAITRPNGPLAAKSGA